MSVRRTLVLSILGAAAILPAVPSAVVAADAGRPGVFAPAAVTNGGWIAARGDRSGLVAAVQEALGAAGLAPQGGADGIFGRYTESAVRQFQTARDLPVTGTVDPSTAVALGLADWGAVTVRRGARGAVVAAVQGALTAAGVPPRGGADGHFGPRTEAATRSFQEQRSLPVTGVVDGATAGALGITDWTVITTLPLPPAAQLGIGTSGPAVVAVQRLLTLVGQAPRGGADGDYGQFTAAAVTAFQRAAGLPATGVVDLATLTALEQAAERSGSASSGSAGAPGGSSTPVSADGLVFPTPPTCSFSDTWGAPRSGGRTHEGVDIMGPKGTPLFAMVTGTITKVTLASSGSIAGNALRLTRDDGTYFFYAHLDAFAPGVTVGGRVEAGAVIGYMGSTGNAASSHLHLEVHPGGGAAVNPYPIVRPLVSC